MGFAKEMEGFISGFESGQKVRRNRADTRIQEAKAEKEEGPPEDYLNAPGDESGGGSKLQPSNPQVEPSKGGGKVDNDTMKVASQLKGDLMRDFKLNDTAATGIVASLAAESGGFKTMQEINPQGGPNARGGYGYAQWTGPRRKQFEKYAADNNLDINSYAANYGFLKTELQGPEGRILADLNNAKDAREATTMFTGSAQSGKGFLRPGIPNWGGRYSWTDRLSGVEPTTSSGDATRPSPDMKPVHPPNATVGKPDDDDGVLPVEKSEPVASAEPLSPEAGIEVAEYHAPQIGTPQVAAANFDLDVGGLSPPRDQEVRPVMWAARGGVIPEPTQNFADGGGVNPSGDPDKYNPARAYTQKLAEPAASTWTPRRVGASPTTVPAAAGAPTSSQQKFRDMQAAAKVQAAAPAATTAAVDPNWEQVMKNQQQSAAMWNAVQGSESMNHDRSGQMMNRTPQKQYGAYTRAKTAAANEAKAAGTDPWMAQQMVDPSKYGGNYRTRGFEEGGVIPEVGFARGGKVENRDETFKRLERNERKVSQHDDGQSSRDTAAKRLSHKEGRPTSSAYRAVKDHPEYWEPRKGGKPGKGGTKGGEPDGTKTSSTSSSGPSDPGEDRATRFRRPQAGLDRNPFDTERGGEPGLSRNPFDTDRGTAPADPGLSRNPYDTDRGAIPAPEGGGVGPITGRPDYPAPNRPGFSRTGPFPPRPGNAGSNPIDMEKVRENDLSGGGPNIGTDVNSGGPDPRQPRVAPVAPGPVINMDEVRAADPYNNGGPNVGTGGNSGVTGKQPELVVEGNNAYLRGEDGVLRPYTPNQERFGYARGGVIPEADEEPVSPRAESAAYSSSAPGTAATMERPAPSAPPAEGPAAEPEKADIQPTPKLLQDVNEAVRGGARFLTRHFGLDGRGDGAMPTPESTAGREDGIRRFASGEGASTPEEINGVDDKVDPGREMNEGDRQMTRLARTSMWYLEHGMKEEAEAAAAGLMQYGAQKFSKLGSMSQAAYSQYLKTKDPSDLEHATKYLEKAYELIPDGGNMNITIDPKTGMLQAQHTTADGKTENYDIKPDEIPGLIQQAQDASGYWKQVFRLSDPTAARAKEQQEYDTDKLKESRTYEEGQKKEGRTYEETQRIEQEKRAEERKLDEEKRGGEAELAKEKRAAEAEAAKDKRELDQTKELKLIDAGLKEPKAGEIDQTALAPVLAEATKLRDAETDDPAALNEAASRLYDIVKDPAKMATYGFPMESFTYVAKGGAADANTPRQAKDGKWYIKGPNGKYVEVEMAAP